MESRRSLLKKLAGFALMLAVPYPLRSSGKAVKPQNKIKNTKPGKAAVIWYSQAGNTARTGGVIERAWRKLGLQVDASDYRDFDSSKIADYDIIAVGSPVFYYDVPDNFQDWIRLLPQVDGTAVAAFVTFGGAGGNQYNTACTLLELMTAKGGVAVGMETFSNMSTFAPTWSMGNEERILKYRHLPDEKTFSAIESYAEKALNNTRTGSPVTVHRKIAFNDLFRGGISIWGTKLCIGDHFVDGEKCIKCGTCVDKCPVDSIDLEKNAVNEDACIACMGCVNNCPAGAVHMTFLWKKVYGFKEFLKRNKIVIKEPKGS